MGKRYGEWEVIGPIGRGGMASVWRVRHPDGRERALKVLHDNQPRGRERFAREGSLLLSMRHPNIVAVDEMNAAADPPWMVMELVEGEPLGNVLARGPVEPGTAVRWMADVASGLASVHARGVRHRDIKPDNLVLDAEAVPHLLDFGIARTVGSERLTQQGFVVGTLNYLPPEVFGDDDPAAIQDTEVADVYALGQTLGELLIGRSAHTTDANGETATGRVIKEKCSWPDLDPRRWNPNIPEDLAQIVAAATRGDPERRTRSAGEFERQLRAWLAARARTPSAGRRDTPAPSPVRAPSQSGVDDPSSVNRTSWPRLDAGVDPARLRRSRETRRTGLWLAAAGAWAVAAALGFSAWWVWAEQGASRSHSAEHQAIAQVAAGVKVAPECAEKLRGEVEIVLAVEHGTLLELQVAAESGTIDRACLVQAFAPLKWPDVPKTEHKARFVFGGP